jgi:hypothetical protein
MVPEHAVVTDVTLKPVAGVVVWGALLVTALAVPAVHKPLIGALVAPEPLAEPQAPLTAAGLEPDSTPEAEAQLAFVPPLLPEQNQFQSVPKPPTTEGVPEAQRLVVGALVTAAPLAEPQTPFTAVVVPPLVAVEPVPPEPVVEPPAAVELEAQLPVKPVSVELPTLCRPMAPSLQM